MYLGQTKQSLGFITRHIIFTCQREHSKNRILFLKLNPEEALLCSGAALLPPTGLWSVQGIIKSRDYWGILGHSPCQKPRSEQHSRIMAQTPRENHLQMAKNKTFCPSHLPLQMEIQLCIRGRSWNLHLGEGTLCNLRKLEQFAQELFQNNDTRKAH